MRVPSKAAFAGVLLLGSVLLASAQTRPDTPTNPFANDPAAIPAGKALFDGACAACHGSGAIGDRGPALNTSSFRHGSEDIDVFNTIRSGIPGTQMPSFTALPADNVWKVVTYLKSLPRGAGSTTVAGNAAAGEALFFGAAGCSGCHEVDGRGMSLASDLSAEGTKPAGAIRAGLQHDAPPPRNPNVPPPPHFVEATMKDGRVIAGLVKTEDSFAIHIQKRDGTYLMLDRADITNLVQQGYAATPALTAKLSSADLDNLVAYLAGHKARDFSQTVKITPAPVLPYARLVASPDPKNWLTYWGGYNGHHFSELGQIDTGNVGRLQARFAAAMLGERPLEATPLVVDGVMYVSGSPGDVAAFDAKSGLQIWSYHRNQDFKNPYQINPVNRGVAVLDGRVFFGTLDDNLIALDAHTGRQLWEKRLADTMLGYTLTGAPLALKDKVVVGVATSESGVRGWLKAFDPATGRELWDYQPVPLPGQKGNETWAGDSWKTGGIGLWLTANFDVETNTIIVGTGQPVPDYNADLRKGDNLYSDCVIGLDADSGKMKWYYQFTPNDAHDWDSVQDMVLADQVIDGKARKLILHADRNGLFYVLDRTNGEFLFAKPFVKQTWNLGFDKNGRPIIDSKSLATAQGQVVYPAIGGTNFQAPSYDAQSKLFYLAYSEAQGFAISAPAVNEPGKQFSGRGTGNPPPAPPPQQGIMAIDSSNGSVRWKFPLVQGSLSAGVLATRGGVVFASSGEGQFIALDAMTGKPLWNFRAGLRINASPIAFEIDGQEYVAVSAGNMIYSFALPK